MTRIRKSPTMTGAFAEVAQEFIQYKRSPVLNTQMNRNAYHDFAVSVKNWVSQK